MRALIRAFDGWLRRRSGVFEFTDDPACLFRLQLVHAPRDVRVRGVDIPAGTPLVGLHLWNEHVPPIPPTGADMAWGLRTYRMLARSLREVAAYLPRDPRLTDARAVWGVTVLIPLPDDPGGGGLIRRLGFEVLPYHGALGRFGEFWENFYTWWIMWTYNPASLRGRTMAGLRRQEMWMLREDFMRRYGGGEA